MQVIEIKETNRTLYLPDDLSECDLRQYIEVSGIIFLLQIGQISYTDFRIHALYKLLNLKAVKTNVFDEEKKSNIYQLSELLNSFFDIDYSNKDEPLRVLKLYYTKNPIPKFLGYFRNYYGPQDDFEDITFGEYLDMLEEFINFSQTNEMIYLHRLLAIGYRPRKLLSRQRTNYNLSKVPKRAKQFKSQHIGIVWGFQLYFASFNSYLSSCKIFVQGSELDFSILFSQDTTDKSEIPGMGMKTVLLSIAESGVYGSLDQVRKTNLWEVLTYMYYVYKKAMDQENENKKQSNQ